MSGAPLDTVSAQAQAEIPSPPCDCSGCLGSGCHRFDFIALDENGLGTSDPLFGNMPYIFKSGLTGGVALQTTPCPGTISVVLDPPGNPDPRGQITISGGGVTCTKIYYGGQFFTICNSGTISLTLDGYTVSTSPATTSSTPSSVALDLANQTRLPAIPTSGHFSRPGP